MRLETRMAGYMGNAAITALVGTRAGPLNAGEQPALPYLVWQRISTSPVTTHEAGTTLEEIVVQVSCFASTHAAAVAIRRAVRSVLDLNHAAGPATYLGATDLGHDDALRVYGVSADFAIWADDQT